MNPIQTNEYKDEPNIVVHGNYSGHQNRELKTRRQKNITNSLTTTTEG